LEEDLVAPERLDAAMQAARASDAVTFASHVYCPANNPSTFFYLTDQITIQFGEQVNEESRNTIANAANLTIIRPVEGLPNTFVYCVSKQATENQVKIANRLTRYPEVLVAQPNILIAFQQLWNQNNPDAQIGEDGGFGSQTEDALNRSPAQGFAKAPRDDNPRTLRLAMPRMEGSDVIKLQEGLKKAGVIVGADGEFGPGTDTAVKEFQQKKGLKPDGIVDRQTREQMA
jgi:peptidoglycan hydrolase-like protein with peptidoglycan-binding domain